MTVMAELILCSLTATGSKTKQHDRLFISPASMSSPFGRQQPCLSLIIGGIVAPCGVLSDHSAPLRKRNSSEDRIPKG